MSYTQAEAEDDGRYTDVAVSELCEALLSGNCVLESLLLGESGMRHEEAASLAAALAVRSSRGPKYTLPTLIF